MAQVLEKHTLSNVTLLKRKISRSVYFLESLQSGVIFLNPNFLVSIDLSTVFSYFDMDKLGKVCQLHWRRTFSKIVKFEGDLLKTNKYKPGRSKILIKFL